MTLSQGLRRFREVTQVCSPDPFGTKCEADGDGGAWQVLLALAAVDLMLAAALELRSAFHPEGWLAATPDGRSRHAVVAIELLLLSFASGFSGAALRRLHLSMRVSSINAPVLTAVIPLFLMLTSESLASLVFSARYPALNPFHEWRPPLAVRDARLGHRPIPIAAGGFATNPQGFRGPDFPAIRTDREIRIVVLGDSTTWGAKLPLEGDTYPRVLERLLRTESSNRQYYILNAGVVGYASVQVRRLLEDHLDRWRPDLVIVCVGWIDLRYSYDADWTPETPVAGGNAIVQQSFDPGVGRFFSWLRRNYSKHHAVHVVDQRAVAAFRSNLAAIVRIATEKHVAILLINPPTVVSRNLTREERQKAIGLDNVDDLAMFQRVIDETCKTGVPCFLDAFPLSEENKDQYFFDCCHLTRTGAAEMSRRLFWFLKTDPRFQWLHKYQQS